MVSELDPVKPTETIALSPSCRKLAEETPAERRVRAEIRADNVHVGHPRAGVRFDAGLLKRPMATADAMIESLVRQAQKRLRSRPLADRLNDWARQAAARERVVAALARRVAKLQ